MRVSRSRHNTTASSQTLNEHSIKDLNHLRVCHLPTAVHLFPTTELELGQKKYSIDLHTLLIDKTTGKSCGVFSLQLSLFYTRGGIFGNAAETAPTPTPPAAAAREPARNPANTPAAARAAHRAAAVARDHPAAGEARLPCVRGAKAMVSCCEAGRERHGEQT